MAETLTPPSSPPLLTPPSSPPPPPIVEENTEILNNDCESIHSESIHSESDDLMSDIEDEEEDDEDVADDDDVEINKQTCALFLQQLWDAQRVNIKKKKQEQFLPLTKKFLSASFAKKDTMLNDNPAIIRNMLFLCRNITNGKIPVDISGVDKALFEYISDKSTPKADVRLHLLEQFAIHHYCRQALRNIENGGKCETTGTDRHGEIQHPDEIARSISKRQKNSRQRKTNSSRRGIN
jgi:hypothetical protein